MQQTRQWSLGPDIYLNVHFLPAATGRWTLECPRPTADLASITGGFKEFSSFHNILSVPSLCMLQKHLLHFQESIKTGEST